MKNWSIVTKIVVLACSLVTSLLIIASGVLIWFEIHHETLFTEQYIREMDLSTSLREAEAEAALVKNVTFNIDILSRVLRNFLYHLDFDRIKILLPPYLEYPEILAIQVLNERSTPITATWKTSVGEVVTAEKFPPDLSFPGATLIRIDVMQDELLVGTLEAYYTDAQLQHKITTTRTINATRQADFRTNSQQRLRRTITGQVLGVLGILAVLITVLGLFLRRLIQKPLRKIANVARQLSALDLTVRLKAKSRDEIGQLFVAINDMVQSFTQTVSLMQQSGHQVFSSAAELAVTAKQHEQTMTSQVDSTNQAAASIDNISRITGELVHTIQQVTDMAHETAEFANRGQSDLFRMEEAMRNMEEASASISEKLETINEKADRITDVVTAINKVSEQTNLLSLNASIEAEKAGEYGRGFAVVAREIRRLADQTAVATLDIGRMVQEMQSAVAAGVMEMDKFVAEVQRSTEDVGRISMQLTLIIDQVQALSPNFENVSIAIGLQSEEARDISALMETLSAGMLETRKALHESFDAIEQLKEAARGLQEEVSKFQVQ